MMPDVITADLKAVLRRLKLGGLLDTLPERLVLARQQQLPHQDFLLLALSDEVARRNSAAVTLRATQAQLDPTMTLEQWDPSAKVTYDRALWNELVSLRFIAAHAHVAIVGPVGVGKTFLAHALGWLACRTATPSSPPPPTRCSRASSTRASITPTSRRSANSSPSMCSYR